jgi:hypothetical protein
MTGSRVHCTVVLLLLIGLRTGLAWGQTTDQGTQDTIPLLVQQIKELQEKTGQLLEKVKALEAAKTEVVSPPETAAAVTDPSGQFTGVMDALQSWRKTHGIQWRGFGEVNYKVLDQRKPELGTNGFVPGSAGNFYTGDFDLFLAAKVSDKANILSEIAFGEGDHQAFNVDLERFLLQYEFNDHLRVSLGRYQTGIGYYNTEFRSTQWLQTTADRPLVMEFAVDGGLLPTQAVGLSITGLVPSGQLGLNYLFEYGSSDTVRPDINGSGRVDDENNSNHVLVGFFVRPEGLHGLRVGASFYHDKIGGASAAEPIRYGQTIVNGHIVYMAHRVEFLAEGFLIRHSVAQSDRIFNMPAFYVQVSKQLRHIRPFFRYQYVNTNIQDIIFDDVDLRYGPSFGARYDFNENIAFKAQLDHTAREDMPDLNGLQMQLVFTF